MFTIEELNQMSKEALLLHIVELYKKVEENAKQKKSKAGVVIVGSPDIVRQHYAHAKRLLEEERSKGGQ